MKNDDNQIYFLQLTWPKSLLLHISANGLVTYAFENMSGCIQK